MIKCIKFFICFQLLLALVSTHSFSQTDKENVKAEHGMINMGNNQLVKGSGVARPGTAWYPQAGFGLFIHWGISSVNNLDISWPMIPGRNLQDKKLSDEELKEIVATKDYNRYANRPKLTPNQYWEMAKSFNPQNFEPEKWIKAAKQAGITYAVLTARHHDGFALWPSRFGNFNTKTFVDGKDLIKLFVEACRKNGIKVGLYYSPPDWYFDKDFMNFLYYKAAAGQPKIPKLDADLNPRTATPDSSALKLHYTAFREYLRGQIKELLTNYGKIDVLWFDGKPNIPHGENVISREEILQLQPSIVINPRLFDNGDFITFEREPPKSNPAGWAEFCNTWTTSWANSTTLPFKAPAFILGQLALCRSWDMNYLLGIGPNAQGGMSPDVYKNLSIVTQWMAANRKAVKNTRELPQGEQANVPATATANARYLFSIPSFKENGTYPEDQLPATDQTLTISIAKAPKAVRLLGKNIQLKYKYANGKLNVDFPAKLHTILVDVVEVIL